MADTVGGAGFPTTGIQKGNLHYNIVDQALWMYINGVPRLVSSWRLVNGEFAIDPDISTWGQNQIGAMWFNTIEGIYKGWNGAEIVLLNNSISTFEFIDDFIGTSSSTTGMPILGWTLGTLGSVALSQSLTPVGNHPGMWRLRTGSSVNDGGVIYLGANGQGTFVATDKFAMTFIVQTGPIADANTFLRAGFDTAPVGNNLTEGILVEKRDVDSAWQFVTTTSAPNTTRVDSGVTVAANTFYRFDIRRISVGQIGFRINLGVETIITTNIPSNGACPFIYVRTADPVAKDFFIDYFRIIFSALSR